MLASFAGFPSSGLSSVQALPGVAAAAETDGKRFDVKRDLLDCIAENRFEAFDATLAPDCLLLLPGMRPVSGAALVKRVLRGLRRPYLTLRFDTVLHFRSADDMFVANSKVHGQRRDGATYDNDALTLVRLDRVGRIALVTEYYKDTSRTDRIDRPHPRHA